MDIQVHSPLLSFYNEHLVDTDPEFAKKIGFSWVSYTQYQRLQF
jgi:hypothetical protein